MRGHRSTDRGSVVVWSAGWVMLAAVIMGLLMAAVQAPVGRSRSQTVADLAALAGAAEGQAAAAEVAARNGARLAAWSRDGEIVDVVVSLDGHRARASATLDGAVLVDPDAGRAP